MVVAVGGMWLPALDGDVRGRALYRRHYSHREYRDGRKPSLFVGPGEKMVLLTLNGDALFVWRKFRDDSGQQGVNCAVFRNESPHLSSDLIREADELAWGRWPGERLYTYVDARHIRSTNPGACFKAAGWTDCGMTKGGLHILEKQATNGPPVGGPGGVPGDGVHQVAQSASELEVRHGEISTALRSMQLRLPQPG